MEVVLKAVKKDTNTTRVKARSVPVDRLNWGVEFFFIAKYYSIGDMPFHPHKVICRFFDLQIYIPGLLPFSHYVLCPIV